MKPVKLMFRRKGGPKLKVVSNVRARQFGANPKQIHLYYLAPVAPISDADRACILEALVLKYPRARKLGIDWEHAEARLRAILWPSEPAPISAPVVAAPQAPDMNGTAEMLGECLQSLRPFARVLSSDRAEADDLLQTAFERVATRGTWPSDREKLLSFLKTVIRNLHTDNWRMRSRSVSMPIEALEQVPAVEDIPNDWQEFSEEDVREAVLRLHEPFRSVMLLYIGGVRITQIAEAMDIPPPTVGTRLLRARRHLKNLLRPP
jgi:RNA polymerase sigma-70 factor (ECF subfamily)